MKMKTVSLLAGVAVPLILAGPASGALIGIKAVKKPVDPADIAADTNHGGVITSLLVVNVYAVFTAGDAAASVIGVGGSAALGIPLQINTRDGTFFQHPLGAGDNTAPSGGLVPIPGFNILKHDSFVTIGAKDDIGDLTGVIGFDPGGWTDTRLTGSPEVSWFLAGFPPQGSPGVGVNPPDQVLIGQYTVANPSTAPGAAPGVFGQMFVNARHTNAAGVVEVITITGTFDNQVPAPGALALLGTAGLLGCRRRRRRS